MSTNPYECPECGSNETYKKERDKRVCTKCGTVFTFTGSPDRNY